MHEDKTNTFSSYSCIKWYNAYFLKKLKVPKGFLSSELYKNKNLKNWLEYTDFIYSDGVCKMQWAIITMFISASDACLTFLIISWKLFMLVALFTVMWNYSQQIIHSKAKKKWHNKGNVHTISLFFLSF